MPGWKIPGAMAVGRGGTKARNARPTWAEDALPCTRYCLEDAYRLRLARALRPRAYERWWEETKISDELPINGLTGPVSADAAILISESATVALQRRLSLQRPLLYIASSCMTSPLFPLAASVAACMPLSAMLPSSRHR
jgi:hypothetical protein